MFEFCGLNMALITKVGLWLLHKTAKVMLFLP